VAFYVVFLLRKPGCSALGTAIVWILVGGSFVFPAAGFRLLNVASFVHPGTVFVVTDDEIKDHLRLKAKQERLAVVGWSS